MVSVLAIDYSEDGQFGKNALDVVQHGPVMGVTFNCRDIGLGSMLSINVFRGASEQHRVRKSRCIQGALQGTGCNEARLSEQKCRTRAHA